MNVLIDNSTYYSLKVAVQENLLDANTVYNMANFVECLIVADKVLLAPTTLWYPDHSDGELFATDGPCAPLQAVADDERGVARVFQKAIDESITDLSSKVIKSSFSSATHDLNKTASLLRSWKTQVNEDPSAFMETYSGLVYLTDVGSSKFSTETFGSHTKSMPSYHHLANFLLRTNVAMEISERLVYHPHSHRAPLVSKKMALKGHQSASLVSALIGDAEGVIEEKFSAIAREAVLSPYKMFSSEDTGLPLVLGVVLSGAKTPADLIPRAMDLRNLRAAQRYRRWMTKLVTSFRGGNPSKKLEAARGLLEARQVLTTELSKLYGAGRESRSVLVSKLTSAVPDPGELASASVRSMLIKASRELAKSTPGILKSLHNLRVRRKVALLINFAKRRREIDNLNSLLGRTFHKKLEAEQLHKLNTLRTNQAKLMAQLILEES